MGRRDTRSVLPWSIPGERPNSSRLVADTFLTVPYRKPKRPNSQAPPTHPCGACVKPVAPASVFFSNTSPLPTGQRVRRRSPGRGKSPKKAIGARSGVEPCRSVWEGAELDRRHMSGAWLTSGVCVSQVRGARPTSLYRTRKVF